MLFLLQENYWYLGLVMRKPNFRGCDQIRHKPACSGTETARVLKFLLQQVEVLYYPGSEQQRRWSVCIWQKQVFSWRGSSFIISHSVRARAITCFANCLCSRETSLAQTVRDIVTPKSLGGPPGGPRLIKTPGVHVQGTIYIANYFQFVLSKNIHWQVVVSTLLYSTHLGSSFTEILQSYFLHISYLKNTTNYIVNSGTDKKGI